MRSWRVVLLALGGQKMHIDIHQHKIVIQRSIHQHMIACVSQHYNPFFHCCLAIQRWPRCLCVAELSALYVSALCEDVYPAVQPGPAYSADTWGRAQVCLSRVWPAVLTEAPCQVPCGRACPRWAQVAPGIATQHGGTELHPHRPHWWTGVPRGWGGACRGSWTHAAAGCTRDTGRGRQ